MPATNTPTKVATSKKFTFTRAEWDAIWFVLKTDFYIDDSDVDFEEGWPDDDRMFDESGVSIVDLDDLAPRWQGTGRCDEDHNIDRIVKRSDGLLKHSDFDRYGLVSFKTLIQRLRKQSKTVTLVVIVDKAKLAEMRELIQKAGGRIQ